MLRLRSVLPLLVCKQHSVTYRLFYPASAFKNTQMKNKLKNGFLYNEAQKVQKKLEAAFIYKRNSKEHLIPHNEA